MIREWGIVILACAIVSAVQGEIIKETASCGRMECKEPTEKKFKYKEDITYQYKYSVDVSTNFGGKPNHPRNETTLFIDAVVSVQFTSPCEGTLRIANASISHDRSRYNPEFPDRAGADFKFGLERFPLRFAFDDGQIQELCPNHQDPVWALNLKRGVLSMLQNTMKRFDVDRRVDELDVNGICDTNYRLYDAKRTSLIVKKTKDLDSCAFGAKHLSIIQSTPYRSPRSRPTKKPLLKSFSECEIVIDHHIYERVVCKDLHQVQPLSTRETGARTESTAVLQLISEAKDAFFFENYEENEEEEEENANRHVKRTDLLYDHSKTTKTMHGELRTARDLLKSMCKLGANADELQQRFSEMFTAFVHSARFLDYPSLSQLFARGNSICKTGKKHIINALPFLGSTAGVNVMKDLIIKKYVSQETTNNWVTTFALIPRPDHEIVRSLSPLLDFQQQIPDAQFILSYSAVIHAFCVKNEASCIRFDQIPRFLSYLEKKIEKGCTPTFHALSEVKETLEALKAIGNMGLETETLPARLRTCVDDESGFLPMEVRVAAIDAHRRLPSCERTRDEFFLNYYRNFTLDPEIRIASYLQAMKCPDYNVVKTIKHTLKMEEVNQVGSFVWSHLTNLYNSASPTRVEIQSLLTDRDIGTKFNSDMRKFSRNYDGSFFSEEYNFGANYQGNLIFSPKSYIPRSASFNLSVDLFGETMNMFEVTTRMEGLEYYAENLFGPDGPYSNEKVTNYFNSFLRVFRSAPEEEEYWKRVKRLPNVIDNNFDHPRVSFSYKIFGNDLKYTMLDGDKEIRTALMKLNPWEKVKQILSGQEIHYENTMMFLDSTYVVPTTSGLPIRLDLAGSAACNFKMSGLLDMKQSANREIEFIGNVMPSVSIDVVGGMTVDAFYKSSGVKLRSNVYSSGALEINLSIKGLHLVRLSLGLPNHKIEVFSISTDVLLVTSNGAEIEERPLGVLIAGQNHKDSRQLVPVPSNIISNTTCSWAALDRLIGLKLCTDYQFSNVTKDPHAPYFVFNGPTLFKMSLIKADPTAKDYLLEYKWEETSLTNTFRLAFDTPGSQINREISATVTFDVETQNVTVLLHSTGNSIIAKGTYKNTKTEMSLDVGFDINGTKHLDASIGYTTKKFNYGYVYSPKLHLTINNERVAALTGTIRNAHKNNVSQCDIDLTFQTKKVWSKLVGYIVKRNISIAGDFQLDYQLQRMPKKETIHLEVSLTNRSSSTLTHKAADLKLHSTAYPQLNTVITTWYQQALGHLELHAEVNSSPHLKDDRHKLTAQLVISYSKLYFQNQGTKVSALFAITKPIQNLDIKVGINHYAVGAESKTNLLIGYAPGKEISLAVNVVMPRGLMFSIEIHANLTIPSFTPMIVDLRINERSRREYEIGFAGTWFSGHNITARGTYSDRSTAAVVSHSLKMILKSPSFPSDILVNCKIHHKHSDLRISLYVEHLDLEKYAFILNHTVISPTRLLSYVEGRYKNNVYSVMTDIDTKREIRVEMHVDKWRDVHLTLTGINEEDKKEFGAEVKWDANRDPSLKFATGIRLERITISASTSPSIRQLPEKKLSALATLTYPGRLVTGSCQLAARGEYNYMMDGIIDWGADRMIRMSIEVDYDVQDTMTSLKLESQLLTPFEQWRRTSLNAKYLQLQNKVIASCSTYWRDSQHVIADFYGSLDEHEGNIEWIGNCGLSSTVHSISWVTANVTHKMLYSHTADTHVLIKYHPDKVIDAWSVWRLDKESDSVFNLTGNLHLESPIASYRKCDMKCQFRLMPDWKLQGAANLDMDKRKYSANLVGDLQHLKESMIQFNLTTPIEKYAFLRGRFGLSESNRHIVAEVVGPAGPLGFEVILQLFTSSYDFNVKLLLATPIDILQKSLLVAKLNSHEADFRIAYNNITAGFQGVWHYQNITDFHYSYILFTPLSGFEEIGIVTKLIILNTKSDEIWNVDMEFIVRVAELKFGVMAKGGPKPPPVRISIKPEFMITTRSPSDDEDYSDENGEEDEDDSFYWKGEAELHLVIIAPIQTELDIDYESNTYKVLGVVQLSEGRIILDDVFWIDDVFHIKNELSIETPFNIANEITSYHVFSLDLDKSVYVVQLDVNVRQNTTWIESGVFGNYTYHESETDDSKTRIVKLNVKTPLDYLKYINTKIITDIDENLYKTSLDIRGENCSIDVKVSLEVEESFTDVHIITEVDSSVLKIPKTEIIGKKDFTDKEKSIKFNVTVAKPISKHALLQSTWLIEDLNYIKISTHLDTWMRDIRDIKANLLYSNSVDVNGTAKLILYVQRADFEEYKLTGNYEEGAIDASLFTPASSKEHLKFEGILTKSGSNRALYNVKGDLENLITNDVYKVSANIVVHNNVSFTVETTISPDTADHGGNHEISIVLKKERYGLKVAVEGNNLKSNVEMNVINSLNWDVRARADIDNKATSKKDKYQLFTFMNVQVNGNTSFYILVETPVQDLKTFTLNGNTYFTNNTGDVRLDHHLNQDHRYLTVQWRIIHQAIFDIFGKLAGGYEIENFGTKDLESQIFFKTSSSGNIATGFDVDIDHEEWKFGANCSLSLPNHENVNAVFSVRLPPPNNDIHRFLVTYHSIRGLQNMTYIVGYNALKAKTNYASDGSVNMRNRDIDGHFRVTWGILPGQFIHNIFKMTFDKKEVGLKYSLYTPKFLNEETVILLFNHNGTIDVRNLINADVYFPARKRVGTARISYVSIVNINGTINASTPTLNFPYIGCNFVVLTTLKQNKRFVEFFWPNNTALLNSDYSYHSEKLDSNLEGVFQLEIPLNTRHVSHLTYGYKKRPQVTYGHGVFTYNKREIVHAQYNSKSESRAGFEKDYIQITVENIYTPIGIVYINQYEYSAGNEGTNYPTVEFKQVNVYRLDNTSAFNIVGESRIRTTHTGQNIYLKAIHSNKTVQLKTDYQILPGEFDQNTWLSLAKDAWVSYHVNILNKTTEEVDNQFIILSLAYPRRNFTLDGSYRITSDELNSDAKLEWDKDKDKPRSLGAAFSWRNFTSSSSVFQQLAVLSLRHPSFEKDVTLKGELLKRSPRELANVAFTVDYSTDPEKLLVLTATLRDESSTSSMPKEKGGFYKYIYKIVGKHPRTQMNLDVEGFVYRYETIIAETRNRAKYKRTFPPGEKGQFNCYLNTELKEFLFQREYNEEVKYLKVRYYPSYPQYVVNGSIINAPGLNATGEFFFDPHEKLTWMMVNYTPDAVESLRMYGKIPDARNAMFDIWRTYEQDLSISDVAFYLKLNHSRLVTSTLRWRPKLKSDILNFTKTTFMNLYDSLNNDADYWKQYIKSETVNVISDVWEDAQDELKEIVNDWNNLKQLETDFEDLKKYLNNSYNENDFYVKDIVACAIYVIDELSLRSHIESLPNILNEIWEIMGESGEAIRNSLLWVIDTIKSAYHKASEIIAAVLRGDSVSQVANIIEKLIEKYDMFIKDLHVSFIKYIENLWNKISISIYQQWQKLLKLIEPSFIRLIHYLETVVWKASKEVVDFMYDRQNEIMTSPYFDRFSKLSQDIDKFYRDIKANDIITNVQKYSALLIQFLQERYFTFVPFGKELKDVVDEIATELKELKKLPSVHYALEKMQQLYERANYFYEYFEIKAKIESFVRLVHSKLVDISQTALQAESRYREAKTMFIFDPNQGLMCLEQKLPMSWHAFNQTPKFHEIPEIKAISDMKSYFVTSNTTFWSLYYKYKPYTEPSNWSPPFKAQAMIAGAQHYTTFDGRYFDFAGSCTYLLARDFVRNTFAILVKYQNTEEITHQIIVLIGENAIEFDVFNDTIRLISNSSNVANDLQLPVALENGTVYVYQKENVVTVERKNDQFRLECNLKFNLCTLELSGWYYGKTAGLLGTMNNEQIDDVTASNGLIVKDIRNFAQSWAIDEEDCHNSFGLTHDAKQEDNAVLEFCDELFVNKSSEFSSCFGVIDPGEYARMCSNSRSDVEVCTIAMAYMQVCMFHDTYLRIPDKCTTCTMIDGSQVAEGEIRRLEGNSVPRSVDVVFIVEAKECNRGIKQNRSIEQLVTQMSKEFKDQNLVGNRWTLVVFGGDGVYDQPRSIILDGQIFTKNAARFVDYFGHLPVGIGSQDIFAAIRFASQLVFRAGVAKTFILMPCSHCEPENQRLDYSVLHQVLLEHDITLHILMDGDFQFEKERLNKIFYGLDATRSYTKKDARTLNGDVDLRRQVKLSKSILGYCTPLSLETNGTIFSGDKLRFDKLASIKKFASVFSKRVALSALPNPCQNCECTANNEGVTQMECMPCVYPIPAPVDYMSETFNLNDSLAALQPLDADYGQIDIEDD